MSKELPIGIHPSGVRHTDSEPDPDLETKFRWVRDSGVYDYIDKTPPPDEVSDYARLAEKYDLPILASGWYYTLGRDEPKIEQNLKIAAELGSRVHNTQIMMYHDDGHVVTNDEVADIYMSTYELGERLGCKPTFEIHINMWSEDFPRVSQVADMVEARGVPFRMTLDHSHVIFKIDNEEEQANPYGDGVTFNIKDAVDSGELILDPFTPGNICDEWIGRGFVHHCHARAAVPNNPRNIKAHHPDGKVGRGVQYPFFEPGPGEYHAEWHAEKLEPWKEVLRRLMAHHASRADNELEMITTEFIFPPDYGAGGGYSIFDNSVACAGWLRETWAEATSSQAAE